MDRPRAALLALAGLLLTLLSTLTPPALAGPVDAGWSVTRTAVSDPDVQTNTATTTSDGGSSAASMTYVYDRGVSSGVPEKTWEFTTTASSVSADGPIAVPYTWQGLHAWAGVTARLEMVVEDGAGQMQVVGPLYDPAPQSCCTTPSNGFITSGVARFDVLSGHRYGFRLSGSNGDYNSFLRGTLTLSTRPYVEALGDDNRQWTGAKTLGDTADTGTVDEAGEARWWKIPVVPGEQVSVTLDDLPSDYDLALYGDVGAAFERLGSGSTPLDLTRLAAGSSGTTPGNGTQVPQYPDDVKSVPTTAAAAGVGAQFAPRVYAPRVYAPRVYAPRVYAPRVYAPRVYAPRVYAGDAYSPDLAGSENFRDAFAAAQSQTLLAVSASTGTVAETVSAGTGNTTGSFYVRVQGHGDASFDAGRPFSISRTVTGAGDCTAVHGYTPADPTDVWTPNITDRTTIIVTDSSRLSFLDLAARDAFVAKLSDLAAQTDGVVIDVGDAEAFPDVQAMQAQARHEAQCAYAANLAAQAIRDAINKVRGPSTRYVVLAGDDEVIPFFRYPDTSGFGEEDDFELQDLLSGQQLTSLTANQVLSQDAYGSVSDLTIGGSSLPLADLAVGRLVKTPEEISSTVDHFLSADGTVITPESSLVTGYDFLADAAGRVQHQVAAGMGVADDSPVAETLVSAYGTPHADSWTADELRAPLLTRHHDLMFLAGHFSANDTLAADFSSTVNAAELAQADGSPVEDPERPGTPLLSDTLVVSPGCHSGYGIVDAAYSGAARDTADWTQRMAQQHAVLVAGTGYQYGDSDFLEYSERLYLGFFEELRTGTAGDPVATGEALVRAKQDYLATLATMTGIDQKAVLEATLYGLPMAGVDLPARSTDGASTSQASPLAAPAGTPGRELGLSTDDLAVDTGIDDLADTQSGGDAHTKQVEGGPTLTWFEGLDGVTTLPGAPVLPKQVVNVSVPDDVLRGVGFRSGTYQQESGLFPLTGAPAVEGTTPNTTFWSPAWFPQQLTSTNYFDALANGTARGRTSLVLSPAQWRSDGSYDQDPQTNTVRAYSRMGVRLFYNDNASTYGGGNQPALAAPPGISDVRGTATGGVVTFSLRATGDPSAGVQEVWVTWTTGPDSTGEGRWESVDLVQDDLDSTRWTGTLDLPDGVDRTDVRFLVQAANGIGAVGLDTAEGNGYAVTDSAADDARLDVTVGDLRPQHPAISAQVMDGSQAPQPGRLVHLRVTPESAEPLFDQVLETDEGGGVSLPSDLVLPLGDAELLVELLPPIGTTPVDVVRRTVTVQDPAAVQLTWDGLPVTRATPGIAAHVTEKDLGTALAGRTVRFTVSQGGVLVATSDQTTDATGTAALPGDLPLEVGPLTIRADVLGGTGAWSTATRSDLVVAHDVLSVTSSELATPVGSDFADPGATVRDARDAPVAGVTVTFTVPGTAPSATFAQGARTVDVTTGADGSAPMPTLTAGDTGGVFLLTVSTPRAASRTVTLGAKYLMSEFVSPVLDGDTTTAKLGSNVPVKIAALKSPGVRIDDQTGADLADDQRVRLTWRKGTIRTRLGPVLGEQMLAYLPDKDFFQTGLKTAPPDFARRATYTVTVTIVAPGSSFDLGSRSFVLSIPK